MAQKRKFQVFISSTFSDLKEERQAAVEAILTAGHIPAGMELFTAGDESQMEVIKRWIDESDIYLLILGSRYGSVEKNSGKSYTQLEYEYAVEKCKPLFAVAISDKANDKRFKKGKSFVETDNPALLKELRTVVTSKMVRFWDDARDIKIAIHEKLSEFNLREDLTGWIPGNEAVNTGLLAEEIVRLTRENNELKLKVSQKSQDVLYSTLTFSEMVSFLKLRKLDDVYIKAFTEEIAKSLKNIANESGDDSLSIYHIFLITREVLLSGYTSSDKKLFYYKVLMPLSEVGIVKIETISKSSHYFALSTTGKQLLVRFRLNKLFDVANAELTEYHKVYENPLPTDLMKF